MLALKLILTAALLAVSSVALPQDSSSESSDQCNDAPLVCCEETAPGNSTYMRQVGSALKMEVDPEKMYATGCEAYNPIDVGGGTECTSAPVCCEDNYFGLLVGVGCVTVPVGV